MAPAENHSLLPMVPSSVKVAPAGAGRLEDQEGPWYACARRMRVLLRPQRRTVEVHGRRTVGRLLADLHILPGTAMVIRGDLLLTDAETVEDEDEIEIRAVISGGSA